MNRRRYRIEANLKTLAKFVGILSQAAPYDSFIQRVSPDINEEYYFVVVVASSEVHDTLKTSAFRDSIQLKAN